MPSKTEKSLGFVVRGDTCVWLLDVPYPRTFMAWLRQQVDFPGRIRDLARDVVDTPETATFHSAGRLRQYMKAHGACEDALETLDEALLVWNVTYGAAEERRRRTGKPTPYMGADAWKQAHHERN